uniref:Uncharacterized protein n=1 Tax=Panagrolaimus superbus TaxID=310955 RepID=A0A914YI39_9BILA
MSNHNSAEYLERVKNMLFHNLKQIDFAPSVGMHEVPASVTVDYTAPIDNANPDVRIPDEISDRIIEHENELYGLFS